MEKFEIQNSKIYLGLVWGNNDNRLRKYQLIKHAAKNNYQLKITQVIHLDLLDLVLCDLGVNHIERVVVQCITDFKDMSEFCMLYEICKNKNIPWMVNMQGIYSEHFKSDSEFMKFINF